jgi:hypothetical protein
MQTNGARVPYGVFTNREWYVREQATVFRGETWSFVALEAEIPKPGDYKSTFVGDTPVIVTRDNDGNIKRLTHHVFKIELAVNKPTIKPSKVEGRSDHKLPQDFSPAQNRVGR